MNIAITSLITRKVGPITYGGTEAFAYDLVENLLKRGHKITLFASSDSQTNASLKSVIDSESARKIELNEKLSLPYYLLLVRKLALESENFDIIHNNFYNTYLVSAFAPFIKKPILHTIHNPYFHYKEWSKVLKLYLEGQNQHVVFLSNYVKSIAGNIPNSYVVPNGININNFPFNNKPSNSLLWIGRMAPEKGASEALQAALTAGKKLLIAMVVKEGQEAYFENQIKPHIGGNITLQESLSEEEKAKAYQNARATLFSIMWEEPFGLVMLESMSSGTPVIAFARGAIPEVIKDGEAGFIVNPSNADMRGDFIVKKTGVEGLCEAIERIYSMPEEKYQTMRNNCRKHIEENFTIEKMIDRYEGLYRKITEGNSNG